MLVASLRETRHSITLAFSSSSSCSYSWPICSRSSRVARASSSSTLEMANPTWIRTQSPGLHASGLAGEQAHVDVAAHADDVHFGDLMDRVDPLDDLAGNRQAHIALSSGSPGASVYHWLGKRWEGT